MILPSASSLGWLAASIAALAYLAPTTLAGLRHSAPHRIALLPAWLLHGLTLAWSLLGAAAHFGFAPALSMTVWLVLGMYAVEREMFPQMRLRRSLVALSLLGAAAVLGAAVWPGRSLPDSASPWLPLHLSLGLACYGLFAAALAHAWLMRRAERHMRLAAASPSGLPLLTLERLMFRFIGAGFVLLSATLVAGWLFGETLYGNAWQWNHKAVFASLAWLCFAVLLLGRARLGWRGRIAARVLYAGSALLLLAYVGTRFVLEVILERTT